MRRSTAPDPFNPETSMAISDAGTASGPYAEFFRRSIEDRDAFWAEQGKLID